MFGSYHLLSRLWIWITYELIHSRLGFTAVFIQFYLWFPRLTKTPVKVQLNVQKNSPNSQTYANIHIYKDEGHLHICFWNVPFFFRNIAHVF